MKALHTIFNLRSNMLLLPAIMVMLALTPSLAQAPANDLCANATTLTCGQTVTGSTLNATIDQTPACGLTFPRYGVWFRFVGTGQQVTFSTCNAGTNYDTQLAVYSGTCAALTCVAGNNNDATCATNGRFSRVTINSVFGTTYWVLLTGVLDARGSYTLTTTCVGVPNDLCSGAFAISCGQTVSGTTVGSTNTGNPGTCVTSLSTAGGVWYRLVGNGGSVTLSLCGSAYDTKIGVFTGTCGALACVTGNDDFSGCTATPGGSGLHSQVTFSSAAGTTYYIYVTGFSTAMGNFTLNATCGAPPCGCQNSTPFGTVTAPTLNTTPTTISTCNFATEYATINSAAAGAQYRFTSSNANDWLTVRQGTPGGAVLGCGTTPLTVTTTAAGPLYLHINTNASCGTATGCRTTTVQCLSCPTPPPPPGCTTATPLNCGGSVTGSTVGIASAPVPTCGTTLNSAGGVWHTLFVPNSGSVTVTTCNAGSNYDTKLGVFSGSCTGLVCVGGNDDATCPFSALRSRVIFNAVGGTTYLVYVTGFGAGVGTYEVSATCPVTLTAPTPGAASMLGDFVGLPEGNLIVGNVFPNPLSGNTANIRVESPKETEAIVRFMDQMGREVMAMESDLFVGENLLQLNIGRLPAGTYFVMIQVEGQVIPRRLVIPRA